MYYINNRFNTCKENNKLYKYYYILSNFMLRNYNNLVINIPNISFKHELSNNLVQNKIN